MQKLKEHIMLKQSSLGSTDSGKDWCLKALHPSDPLTEVRGIPDTSAIPSVFMNYQSTFTLGPTPDATGTWSFDSLLVPHPVSFMWSLRKDSLVPDGNVINFDNPQLEGINHQAKMTSLLASAQRWRLAYMSVTVHQDGPDLANQGSLVAAQYAMEPQYFNLCATQPTGDARVSRLVGFPRCAAWQRADVPGFERSQAMPNAYFNASKEGCYMPLKLTDTCQKWHSLADCEQNYYVTTLGKSGAYIAVGEDSPPVIEFPTSAPSCFYDGTTYLMSNAVTSPLCNSVVGAISARNLSVQTSMTFFVRAGYEFQVQPSSMLAPHQKLSPSYDPEAIRAYFAVARELKDAYPADFNDLGKIWDVISDVAKSVAPAISAIPGYGTLIGSGINLATGIGDSIRRKSKKKEINRILVRPELGSMADLEKVNHTLANSGTKQVLSRGRTFLNSPAVKRGLSR